MIYRTETPQSIEDIPKREIVERGFGCTLVGVEERLRCLASGVDGEKVAKECNRSLSGLNGDVGPVHDTGQTPAAIEQQVSRVVVVVTEDGR